MVMELSLIKLVSGVVLLLLVAGAVAVDAQPAVKVHQVGVPAAGSSPSPLMDEFRQGLGEFGWVEGRNIRIVYRYAEGHLDRLPDIVAELVRMRVDVILATTPAVLAAARDTTKTVPIVMVFGPDPVESGLVASLARPGGNITGLTSLSADLAPKQLELLKEMVRGLARVAVLWNPGNPWHAPAVKRGEVAARALGLRLQVLAVRGPDEYDAAFAAMARERAGAVLGLSDPITFLHRARLADLAVKHRLPLMYGVIEYTEAGALASYWPNSADMFRRAASYVHRILTGIRPGDLPIEQPLKFELVVNLRTAKALGLTISPSLLLRVDRLIE